MIPLRPAAIRSLFRIPARWPRTRASNPYFGSLRSFSASASPPNNSDGEKQAPPKSFLDQIPDRLNDSFRTFPRESVAAMMLVEIFSIYGTHELILASGVQIPVEFGVAFAMGRPFRRLRLPLEVAGAAFLTKVVPQFSQVQLSLLSGVAPKNTQQWAAARTTPAMEKVKDVMNKYGAAYFISARLVGVCVVCSFFAGLRMGVDVNPVLDYFGVAAYGSVIGEWAAAVTLSAIVYPANVVIGGGVVAPFLGNLRKSMFTSSTPK